MIPYDTKTGYRRVFSLGIPFCSMVVFIVLHPIVNRYTFSLSKVQRV